MIRILILIVALAGTPGISHAWTLTPVTHSGKHAEEGYVFEPVCPQPRQTKTAPARYLNMVNPLQVTSENISGGESLFHFDVHPVPCRVCHGISGNGLGFLVEKLDPGSRNFTCKRTMKNIPDGQMFWVIRNGSDGTAMPAFKNLTDTQVWQLILYIRHFEEVEEP